MEEPKNIIQVNQHEDNNTNITENGTAHPMSIRNNSFSNQKYHNSELSYNPIKNEEEENQHNNNLHTPYKQKQDYKVHTDLDKSKNTKKYMSNYYSKSPSHRNNNKKINNHIIINKVVKPFFTSKYILLNKYSLKEVNECIYKDYNQLANILPYYQNYYFQNKINNNNYNYKNNNFNNYNNNANNNDAILICLKYIEYTNFFFNNDITYKVQNLLFNIINGDRRILEQNKYNYLKNKFNEVYNKLIPFHIRYGYLKAFYDRNPDKNLYYLFKKDLEKISMSKYIDKKNLNYLNEIFEIVKQKMEIKKDIIKSYINKLYNNSILNSSNNSKNGGNYNHNFENINNNVDIINNDYKSYNSRKHSFSFQYSAGQNNNSYMNGSNKKYNDINNKDISQFSNYNYNKDNSFKQNSSRHHYYYKNNNNRIINNNEREYLRNKNNKASSFYKSDLVEIEDINNNTNLKDDENKLEENNTQNINNDIDEEEYKDLMTHDKDNENENNNIIINDNDIDTDKENINKCIKDVDIKDEEKKDKDTDKEHIININVDNNGINQNNLNNINLKINNNISNNGKDDINSNDNNPMINYDNDNEINGKDNMNSLENMEENNINDQEEKKLVIPQNINPDINGTINNNNKDINDNEENNIENSNKELNTYDFLYNTDNNINNYDNKKDDQNNLKKCNSDNNLPKITYNDFDSPNNSLVLNEKNSSPNLIYNSPNNLINNNMNNIDYKNKINDNIMNSFNTININNIINSYKNYFNLNLNNGFLNNNDLSQIFKQILFTQKNIMTNLNKSVYQFNQIKLVNNNNLQNILYDNNILNVYSLGINNNIYNLNSYNLHGDKNYNLYNNSYYFNKQEKMIESEYNKIKKIEKENPDEIKKNINFFENNILLPIYNQINTNNNNSDIISKYSKVYLKYKDTINSILTKNNLDDTIVEPYGSIINNFLTKDGDIDISIVPKNISKDAFIKYLNEIEEVLVKEKKYAMEKNNIYINSRYALLSVTDIETNINIDITVHNKLPINNSKMIRLYSLYDQRFHILGIFLKYWVKINNIKGAPNGYLSSYALLILIIHFLQNVVEPKVLPILQKVRNVQKEYKYFNGEKELTTNLYFEEDFENIKQYMNEINCGKENDLNVTELLVQFFEYYAYKYNMNNHYLITIKDSVKKVADNCEQIVFPIEDPFDVAHNPGKTLKYNTQQHYEFILCMKKEINNILSGEYFKYISY